MRNVIMNLFKATIPLGLQAGAPVGLVWSLGRCLAFYFHRSKMSRAQHRVIVHSLSGASIRGGLIRCCHVVDELFISIFSVDDAAAFRIGTGST